MNLSPHSLDTPPLSDWPSALALLARLHPPHSVWHVGSQPAGAPSYLWQQWGVPHALLINPLAQAQDNLPEGWVQCNSVLAAEAAASADFYRASLPAEAGLLPPEALRPLWPNIHTTDIEQRPVNTLAQLPQLLPGHPAPNWLMVDTLPALPVLQGGAELVAQAQVVTVRVLLANPVESHLAACTLPAVQHLMHQLGFVGVAVYPSHNPQLGQALFVRNWPQQLQHSQHTAHQQVQALQHRIQALSQDQSLLLQNLQQEIAIRQGLEAELATQNQNWAAQADLLRHQLAQGQDQLNHQAHTLAQLTQARAQEAQATTQLQAQLQTLSQAHAQLHTTLQTESQAKAEALQQLQQETTTRQGLEAHINAQAQVHTAQVLELTQVRDTEAQAKAEALQQLQQETATRQGLEAQINAQAQAHAAQVHELTQARDAEAQAKAEALQQLQQETTTRQGLEAQINAQAQAHAAQVHELTQARDAEAQAKTDTLQQLQQETTTRQGLEAQINAQAQAHAAQVHELTQARDAEAQAKTEALQQLQQETTTRQGLEAQINVQAQTHAAQVLELTQARDAEAQEKAEALQQLQQETTTRQGLEAELATKTQNWAAQADLLRQQLAQGQDQLNHQADTLAQWTQAREQEAQVTAQLQAQLQTLSQAHARLDAALQTENQIKTETLLLLQHETTARQGLEAQINAQAQAHAAQVHELTQARDVEATAKIETLQLLHQETTTRQNVEDALSNLTVTHSSQLLDFSNKLEAAKVDSENLEILLTEEKNKYKELEENYEKTTTNFTALKSLVIEYQQKLDVETSKRKKLEDYLEKQIRIKSTFQNAYAKILLETQTENTIDLEYSQNESEQDIRTREIKKIEHQLKFAKILIKTSQQNKEQAPEKSK